MAIEIKMGTTVSFAGGTGRGNEEEIVSGEVNGKPMIFFHEGGAKALIPVYVSETDQIVYVGLGNVVGAEPAEEEAPLHG